jgi:hypothetical protein
MYAKIQETIAGNIKFLTSQLNDYMRQYQCRNSYELFNHKFEDLNEKVLVHSIIHRRDTFVYIGNLIANEPMSIKEQLKDSVSGVIPVSRKWETISNAFSRGVETALNEVSLDESEILNSVDDDDYERAAHLVKNGKLSTALPLIAALWYDSEMEVLNDNESPPLQQA